MAGINSSVVNLIYDYIEPQQRTAALALKSALAGAAGFLTTLAVSPLVKYIQESETLFLGLKVYAQQITSSIAFMLMIILLVYMNTIIRNLKKR
jgi:Na+/melibiose symporter-like transporter